MVIEIALFDGREAGEADKLQITSFLGEDGDEDTYQE